MAHDKFEQLHTLLGLLDDPRNDLYLHIDIKAGEVDLDAIRAAAPSSRLFFIERKNVNWGGSSQIDCELRLLEAAVGEASKERLAANTGRDAGGGQAENGGQTENDGEAAGGKYDYYHLLSGVDLPLKNQNHIHDFFDRHRGREFVDCTPEQPEYEKRVRVYHPLVNLIGRRRGILKSLERGTFNIQTWLGVRRHKHMTFYKGANWFSITGELAEYVLSHKKSIEKTYRFTRCADEIFLQTLVVGSRFEQRLFAPGPDRNMSVIVRLIDWKRGEPYTFRKEDFEQLVSSENLFARKFDETIDPEIIRMVARHVEKS